MSTTAETPIQARLGRYKIVSELGRGAMGTVFHGLDETIERSVALKTLHAELPPEILTEVSERFLREAKSAGKLNHPNIVTIYEFGQDGNIAFIAMEFLEGTSLQQIMRGGRLPFNTIVDLVAQVADGLDYAHRFGVVHRDIKPANIMVSSSGLAKLTDFGIARIQSSSMTQTGAMLGSPKYMSPEQVLGQATDGRADIFSLGVMLYEMLAGRTPFETPDITVFSLMQRIVTVPHPALSESAPDVPAAFEAILARALAKRPEGRYARAEEMASDLRKLREGQGSGGAAQTLTSSAPVTDYERTVLTASTAPVPTAARAPVNPGAASNLAAFEVTVVNAPAEVSLLGDLDQLGAGLDEIHKKIADEETSTLTSRRVSAASAKVWDGMADGIEAAPRPGAPAADKPSGSANKSSVFGLLQQQAGGHLKELARAQENAAQTALLELDAKLRSGYAFLTEFMGAANAASPVYAAKHSLPLMGELPPLYLAEGVVNTRSKRVAVGGLPKDFVEEIIVSYNLLSAVPQRASYKMPELQQFKALLDEQEIKYKIKETRDAKGEVTHAGFEYDLRILCAMTLRPDVTGQAIDIVCRNIGPLGRRRYRVLTSMLGDGLYEELSKTMLGHFSALLARQAVRA